MKRKRIALLLICVLLCLVGCGTSSEETATPSPTVEVTATPEPAPSATPQPVSILASAEEYMEQRGYSCSQMRQLGDSYLLSGYQLAVLSGVYERDGREQQMLHLAHLEFANGEYKVLNLYPGNAPSDAGIYPNLVNINGRTVIWTACAGENMNYTSLRFAFADGTSEDVPIAGQAAVYRLESGQELVGIVPVTEEQTALQELAFDGDALTPLVNVTYGNEMEIDPMTGAVVMICGYPEAPDEDSKRALTDALLETGMMAQRTNYSLLSAKEYSGKVFACITYTRNGETVYELIISKLTLEGYFEIIGVGEFAPPQDAGYRMYSTAIENDIICWTLLNETRSDDNRVVPMDFNAFRFYWENGETKDDYVMDRFFVYYNRHVPLPTRCVPIVNGEEISELAGNITRVYLEEP